LKDTYKDKMIDTDLLKDIC